MRHVLYVSGLTVALLSAAAPAFAGAVVAVPEIGAGSLSAGLGLLAGGVLLLRARFGRR
jgi:hypothetical protein